MSFSAACEACATKIRNAILPAEFSIRQKEYAVRRKLNKPGLWHIAEGFPLLLEYFRLNLKILQARRRCLHGSRDISNQAKIQRDAKRRLCHRNETAGEHILAALAPQFSRRAHAHVVRTNGDVRGRLRKVLSDAKFAAPVERFDGAVGGAASARKNSCIR